MATGIAQNHSLTIYIEYKCNHVDYRLAFDKTSRQLRINDFETVLSAKDFKKFARQRNKFNTSGRGCGNFILNGLEKAYEF